MSDVSNIYSNVGATYGQDYATKAKDQKAEPEKAVTETGKKPYISGKTIGKPQLSEKAQKYYEELKSKFHNMDFILVSNDEKENAKRNAASYAHGNKLVVLVDEAKIERMAEDAQFRAQYEGIIERAANGFNQFAESVTSTGAKVKGYGMQVNDDGTTSMFAVLEKSSEAQAKRIEEKREANRAVKKAEAKKAAKERAEERLEEARESRRSDKSSKTDNSDEIVLKANSWEELLRKIEDHVQTEKSNTVFTETEKSIGQSIDFSV